MTQDSKDIVVIKDGHHLHKHEHMSDLDIFIAAMRHVSNGGFLTEFCRGLNISYPDLISSINANHTSRQHWKDAQEARKEFTRERIADEIMAMGTARLSDMFDDNGEPLPMDKIPDNIKRAIAGIDRSVRYDKDGEQTVTTKLKMIDKLKSLDLMAKLDGLLVQKHEVKAKLTLESLLTDSYKKETDVVENEQENIIKGPARPDGNG